MECYELKKTYVFEEFDYDPLLDEVLHIQKKHMINNEEKKHVKCGDYLKLEEKNIWLQFHYQNFMRCRIVGFFEDNCFKIWSMISTPQRIGLGTKTLEILYKKLKDANANLKIYAVEVFPTAIEFWTKMKSRNLISDFELS